MKKIAFTLLTLALIIGAVITLMFVSPNAKAVRAIRGELGTDIQVVKTDYQADVRGYIIPDTNGETNTMYWKIENPIESTYLFVFDEGKRVEPAYGSDPVFDEKHCIMPSYKQGKNYHDGAFAYVYDNEVGLILEENAGYEVDSVWIWDIRAHKISLAWNAEKTSE